MSLNIVSDTARGTFDVQLKPQPADSYADGQILGSMTFDKQYQGDLEAIGVGQMLTGMTSTDGSAVYVAVERLQGTIAGRRGSFIIHHRGIMDRGAHVLDVSVVPDSGTDELEGLHGTMSIAISEGIHSYEFTYGFRERHEAG
jgi:hypothetical protein